ncbi:glycosyltransferase family 2 protein [Verrucomicrobium sp. BvORR034]|jgi:glycosyltransferase involved in cell wall biosynthesis|uniref:glycosyltransferase family 2 protein n=1 Tax=Verrucomicrobium sp. BvORR034 TaxID=1396418 RepID=UPI0006798237|nr:glycosyltransferase family 2 protein [Verrucomicrobium sp. BvORR034]
MPERSRTHLLLIPSFNTGAKLVETVKGALEEWSPVWVVVDGSTDGSEKAVEALLSEHEGDLRILKLPTNSGKGSAVLRGTTEAVAEGYTHVLTMDADGQHASGSIRKFMEASQSKPEAVVLGLPQFDSSAPLIRLRGRRIANWWARLETMSDLGDCLFGFRVYPAAPLKQVMHKTRWARRFDFDPEVAMRLIWKGHPPLNVPAPCRYFTKAEGGVSHFNYYRDNVLLTWMFTRLFFGFLLRLPKLLGRKLRSN